MRRRRRFKPKVSWFPPLGVRFTIGDTVNIFGGDTFAISVLSSGDTNVLERELTFDFSQEGQIAVANENLLNISMADLMGSSWRVRRIVGNVWGTYAFDGESTQDIPANSPPACWFAAGFMVRRVGEDGQPLANNVDPLDADDYSDPWIWRRVWLLGQNTEPGRFNLIQVQKGNAGLGGAASSAIIHPFGHFPSSTAHYTHLATGPHVDQKTNRVIAADERLFFILATKAVPVQPQPYATNNQAVTGAFDFRYLGSLMRATNRRNASR